MSEKFSLDKADAVHVLKVFGYSVGSAAVGALITLIPSIHVPAQYAVIMGLLIPSVNTALVALQRFLADRTK